MKLLDAEIIKQQRKFAELPIKISSRTLIKSENNVNFFWIQTYGNWIKFLWKSIQTKSADDYSEIYKTIPVLPRFPVFFSF